MRRHSLLALLRLGSSFALGALLLSGCTRAESSPEAGSAVAPAASGHDGNLPACSPGLGRDVVPTFLRAPKGVVVVGSTLVLATAVGLELYDDVDLAQDASPSPLGWLPLAGGGVAVRASGSLVAVALGAGGVSLVDVSNSAAPTLVSTSSTEGAAVGLWLTPTRMYVAEGDAGVSSWDISNPAAPVPLARFDVGGSAHQLVGYADRLLVAAGYGGFVVLDPVFGSSARLDTQGEAVDVVTLGTYAYVAARLGGLRVIDLSEVDAPSEAWAHAWERNDPDGMLVAATVLVDAARARLVVGADGIGPTLSVFDVSAPTQPVELGHSDDRIGTGGLALAGDRLWSVGGWLGQFDLSDAVSPRLVRRTGPGGDDEAQHLDVDSGYAFVTLGRDGVDVLDLEAEGGPARVGHLATEAPADRVAIDGARAYVSLNTGGGFNIEGRLLVVDASNPAAPNVQGWLRLAYPPWSIAPYGEVVYVPQTGVDVVDVSDPTKPRIVNTVARDFGALSAAAVDGNLLAACRQNTGVRLFDVTNPREPLVMGTYETNEDVIDVAVQGTRVYVADAAHTTPSVLWQGGVRVLDASDPSHPVSVGRLVMPSGARALSVSGDTLWALTQTEVRAISLAGGAFTQVGVQLSAAGAPVGVAADDDGAWVVDPGVELSRFHVGCDATTSTP